VAGLKIPLLRPKPTGKIVTQSGDIDNRLKTLLDALKMPDPGSLPRGASPNSDESPFFCLLQDDNLITSLDVTTDRLLDSSSTIHYDLLLLVHVQTKIVRYGETNIIFGV